MGRAGELNAVTERKGVSQLAIGIGAALLAIAGIARGFTKKNTPLLVTSIIVLVLVIAVWVYFAMNPY